MYRRDVFYLRGHGHQHLTALLHREQGLPFIQITGDGHNQLVEQLAPAMDQIEMPVRDGIERSGIDGDNVLQEASER